MKRFTWLLLFVLLLPSTASPMTMAEASVFCGSGAHATQIRSVTVNGEKSTEIHCVADAQTPKDDDYWWNQREWWTRVRVGGNLGGNQGGPGNVPGGEPLSNITNKGEAVVAAPKAKNDAPGQKKLDAACKEAQTKAAWTMLAVEAALVAGKGVYWLFNNGETKTIKTSFGTGPELAGWNHLSEGVMSGNSAYPQYETSMWSLAQDTAGAAPHSVSAPGWMQKPAPVQVSGRAPFPGIRSGWNAVGFGLGVGAGAWSMSHAWADAWVDTWEGRGAAETFADALHTSAFGQSYEEASTRLKESQAAMNSPEYYACGGK